MADFRSAPEPPEDVDPLTEGEPLRDGSGGRGPVESLLQELIRRAATIGLGGFFLTEEAIRRAFSDVVPQDWVRFVARQSQDTRRELVDRMAQEFGSWLRALQPDMLVRAALERFSFSIRIELEARPRAKPDSDPAGDAGQAEG